ncbi:MAG: ATP-binding protein, partial [Rhodothermales bacterium]
IFDRFHQVDGTISKVQEGTGIGLALVKELVELHGGTIRVESEVGAGSEFIVTLPKDTRQLDADNDDSWEPIEAVSLGPMVEMAVFDDSCETTDPAGDTALTSPPDAPTILVVDDNPEIRAYVAGCLKHTYRVVEACDGLDALEKAAACRPDLITSDVMMPNLDGYGLCRAIKADKSLSHIPIILLTSRASLDEKIKGLEAGCDDYLTKPFSARELLGRSRNLLHLGMQKRELKALNEALKQTNAELREVSQMKSQLLRIAAHDLKNPLNGIREFAKILKEEIVPHASSRELLDLIETSSDQMLNMVGEILDSEVLESGEVVLETESVSLCEIAEEVIRRNRPQAERKGEKLLLWLDENDPCLVEGSREWLRDAMDNLVSNAVKFSPFNKTIWVTVKKRGSIILFSVRDEGPGLTEGDKKKLFGKFQRLSATPTNNESSTGLGLSIVKQIVELHGGCVWAESTLGAGSTFTIELSRSSGGGATKGHSVPPSRKGGTSSISGPAEAR